MEKFSIHDVIHDLNGTALDLQTVLSDYGRDEEDLSEIDRITLDSEIFCCDCCGWWCETSEQNDNEETGVSICNDCKEDDADIDEYL